VPAQSPARNASPACIATRSVAGRHSVAGGSRQQKSQNGFSQEIEDNVDVRSTGAVSQVAADVLGG